MKAKKIITATKNIDLDVVNVTLLTVEEAKKIPMEVLTAVHCRWWLRSPGYEDGLAACALGEFGCIDVFGRYVNNEYGVRPAITFMSPDLEVGNRFTVFDYEWIVISPNKALCDDIIGYSPFRQDCTVPDANDYEKSDIKKRLDWWFTHICYDKEDDAE